MEASQWVQQLEQLVASMPASVTTDDTLRQRALTVATSAKTRLSTVHDVVFDQTWAAMDVVVLAIACDLRLFQLIAGSKEPRVQLDKLVQETKADKTLLVRILNYLAAIGCVDHLDRDTFAANELTHAYTDKGRQGNIYHGEMGLSCWAALPAQLQRDGYRDPSDALRSAFQLGKGYDGSFWAWLKQHPKYDQAFNDYMGAVRPQTESDLASNFPATRYFAGTTPEEVLMVDVGGGQGHQSASLRKTFGISTGRVVLQDLPNVLKDVHLPDVEVMEYDMFTPQPIKAARVYYFRGVLHDHADHVCRQFLANTIDAMASGGKSKLLINDKVVPDVGAPLDTVRLDIAMMAQFAATERTESQWRGLLEPLGLKIVDIHDYGNLSWRIIICERP